MIDASELRIGNKIYINWIEGKRIETNYGVFKVASGLSEIIKDDEWHISVSANGLPTKLIYAEPIMLTPEILENNCGFESYGDNKEYFEHNNLTGLEFLNQSADFKVFDTGSVVLTYLKYLHQLQNFYFALRDEELQIKDL